LGKEEKKEENQKIQVGGFNINIPSNPQELQQMIEPFIPVIDEFMVSRYIRPLAERINSLENVLKQLAEGLTKAQSQSPNPQQQAVINPLNNPLGNPLIGALMSAFTGSKGLGESLARDAELLTSLAKIFNAVDAIRGRSMWDKIMEKTVPKLFIKQFEASGLLTKEEVKALEKEIEKE